MPMKALAAVSALVFACPAAAAPPPVYLPTRDVSVDYRVTASGPHPDSVTMDYSARAGRARIGAAAGGIYAIVDRRAGRLLLVLDLLRAFIERPFDPSEGYGLRIDRDAAFTRLGPDRVAGASCRNWSIHTDQGDATACLTPDGVILRAAVDGRRGHGGLEATRISYAPQPEGLFGIPDGYTPLAPELLPPAMRGRLPAG